MREILIVLHVTHNSRKYYELVIIFNINIIPRYFELAMKLNTNIILV